MEIDEKNWWQDPEFLQKQSTLGSILSFLLFLLFLGLKLGHVIDWSWWWVTIPLWGGFALLIGLLASFFGFRSPEDWKLN